MPPTAAVIPPRPTAQQQQPPAPSAFPVDPPARPGVAGDQPPTTQVDAGAAALAAPCRLIVDTAALAVPGATWVSITLAVTEPAGQNFHTGHANADVALWIDDLQYDAGDGPCVTTASAMAGEVCSVDLARDPRWPGFGTAAARLGVGSALSFSLLDRQHSIGSLNLYGSTTHAFTDAGQQLGRMLAAQAAHTLAAVSKQRNLQIALETRDLIGQAKGILMNQRRITPDQAFRLLVQASTATNRKLRDIAEYLTATGELPTRSISDRSPADPHRR